MPRLYTQTGDDGYTGLLGEDRIPKYHPQAEAIGCLDEASAALGIARAVSKAPQTGPFILTVQRDLYHMMAEIAASPKNSARFRVIDTARVTWLEEQAQAFGAEINMPDDFILPGDSLAGAAMALARAVVRRAERRVAELTHTHLIDNPQLLRYINRLSSLCFAIELLENQVSGVASSTLAKDSDKP